LVSQNNNSNTHYYSLGGKEKERIKEGYKSQTKTKMPSIIKTMGTVALGFATVASALPSHPRWTPSQVQIHERIKRQGVVNAASGLANTDILQLYVKVPRCDGVMEFG
jgi:hypothetical protein